MPTGREVAVQNPISRRSFAAFLVVALLSIPLFSLFGCDVEIVIGTKSDSSSMVSMRNEIGQAIMEVSAGGSDAQDIPDPLAQEDAWDEGVTAMVYLDLAKIRAESSDEPAPEARASAAPELVSLQLVTIDGGVFALHQLDWADIKDATIMYENGTAYLVYTSKETNEDVNTFDDEIAYQREITSSAQGRE